MPLLTIIYNSLDYLRMSGTVFDFSLSKIKKTHFERTILDNPMTSIIKTCIKIKPAFLLLFTIIILMSSPVLAQKKSPNRVILPQFEAMLAELSSQTQVPILLPSTLPYSYDTKELGFSTYINSSGKTFYSVDLGFGDCDGATYCTFGDLMGEKIKSKSVFGIHTYEGHKRKNAKIITLAKGIKGYYFPTHCGGAGCDHAAIWWEMNGYRYRVGLKGERFPMVKKLANSVILNAQPAQVSSSRPTKKKS